MKKDNGYKVGSDAKGLRLDLFLTRAMKGVSRKKVKALLDKGLVLINGRKVIIASWELEEGDEVEVLSEEKGPRAHDASEYFLKVVFEDPYLLVVEKDAGILCEPSPLALKPTMVEIINAYLKRKNPGLSHHYVGLIHRLDTETSGLMVYTKRKEANSLINQFKAHTVKRRYLAVVEGRIEKERGKISLNLEKCDGPGGRKVRVAAPGKGQKAETNFKVLERYRCATLLEVSLNTGRTHQIRAHLLSEGHPIVGEKIYRDPLKKPLVSSKRQALHAHFLGFHHPVINELVEFKSNLPRDLNKLVDQLRMSC